MSHVRRHKFCSKKAQYVAGMSDVRNLCLPFSQALTSDIPATYCAFFEQDLCLPFSQALANSFFVGPTNKKAISQSLSKFCSKKAQYVAGMSVNI
eukprot:g78025.t1